MKKEKKERKEKKIKREKKNNKFFEIIKNKWLIKGTTTLLLVAIVIACYVLINFGVSKLKIEDIDCTEKKLYSLSDETKSKMANLDKDITIQLINMKDVNYVIEYANKYPAISKKINVEKITNDKNTTIAYWPLKEHQPYSCSDSLHHIPAKVTNPTWEINKHTKWVKEKTLELDDLTTIDYTTGSYIDKTEESITNAIVEVTIDKKPHVYVLTGKSYYNAEQALSLIISELQNESNDVDPIDILTKGEIPEDCSCLVITTLGQDLSELERDKILDYINNGGRILMLTSQNMLDIDTPNFNKILEQYGVTFGYGALLEQDGSKMLSNSPNLIIENANASFMSKLDMRLQMCLINAGKIELSDDAKLEELGVTYEIIAETSDKAFIRKDFTTSSSSRTEKDEAEGSVIIGTYITKKISDDKDSQLIMYSNELFASDLPVQYAQYTTNAVNLYNNKDIILNSISHLTERTDTIAARKKDDTQPYTVTDQQDVIIKTIIFVVPMLIILVGIVVGVYRKRKR